MNYAILLTESAATDLEELYHYLDTHAVDGRADYVLREIEARFASLAENPERGRIPSELLDLGIIDFREIFFKPYRIIYRVDQSTVLIYLIVDGRRNMQSILQRRLFQK